MIAVDASAIVAILMREPEAEAFLQVLARSPCRLSPVGYWEAATTVERYRGQTGLEDLDRLLDNFDIRIAPADEWTAREAADAQRRYGKRTPARLGDCFAYALARQLDAPLLFKGDDFALTDIRSAVPA
ncbi:type II toxin-antitoxin system VapC family toxin [Brevundimonas sp.]|uniref:type II toxin-antitoxin system VapC family toxin n=1 Tax=Brevundimonas sp. TaxID=1871086 RepID=UPI0035AEDAA1